MQRERERLKNTSLIQVKEERLETPKERGLNADPEVKREPLSPKPLNEVDSLNLFLQKPGSFSKLSKLLEVAMMSDETKQTALPSSPAPDPILDVQTGSYLNSHTYLSHTNQQLHKVLTERNSHWFSLVPRSPCDGSSLTEGAVTLPRLTSSSSSPQISNGWVRSPSATSPTGTRVSAGANGAAGINNSSLTALRVCVCLSLKSHFLKRVSFASSSILSSQYLDLKQFGCHFDLLLCADEVCDGSAFLFMVQREGLIWGLHSPHSQWSSTTRWKF